MRREFPRQGFLRREVLFRVLLSEATGASRKIVAHHHPGPAIGDAGRRIRGKSWTWPMSGSDGAACDGTTSMGRHLRGWALACSGTNTG